jgi:hypothetical protein
MMMMALRNVTEKEMRTVILQAVLPAWGSVVVLGFIFHELDWPAYVSLGACFFIAVTMQAALQARVLCPSRPLRYWILTGVLAVAGAGASARIAFR